MAAQEIIGSSGKNLVLKTAGKVYINVGGKYYDLDFGKLSGSGTVNNYVTKEALQKELSENYVTSRNWEDVKIAQKQLEKSISTLGDNFSSAISPVAVNTMQVAVGTTNSQFEWILGYDPTVTTYDYENIFDAFNPTIFISGDWLYIQNNCWLKHYTLNGPTEAKPKYCIWEYAKWYITTGDEDPYKSFYLQEKKDYWLYIKVNDIYGSDYEGDHKDEGIGEFVLTDTAKELKAEEGYYYLLYAFVHAQTGKVDTWNGFTEITPNQVTTNKLSSSDGNQYIDFVNNSFRLADQSDSQHIEWNIDGSNTLDIKGKLNVTNGGTIGDFKIQLGHLQAGESVKVNFCGQQPVFTNGTIFAINGYSATEIPPSPEFPITIGVRDPINVARYFTFDNNWQNLSYNKSNSSLMINGYLVANSFKIEISDNNITFTDCVYDYFGLNLRGSNVSISTFCTPGDFNSKAFAIESNGGLFRGFRPEFTIVNDDVNASSYGGIFILNNTQDKTVALPNNPPIGTMFEGWQPSTGHIHFRGSNIYGYNNQHYNEAVTNGGISKIIWDGVQWWPINLTVQNY